MEIENQNVLIISFWSTIKANQNNQTYIFIWHGLVKTQVEFICKTFKDDWISEDDKIPCIGYYFNRDRLFFLF